MSKFNAKMLCRVAVLAALYVLLTLVSIRAGNLRIGFASLPVAVAALLFGPWEAVLTALLGEFLNQTLSYGFTATTVLWLLPPAVRGLIIGLAAKRCRKRGRSLDQRPLWYYTVCIVAAIVTTLVNTVFIWLESVLYGYYTFAYVFGDTLLRLGTGMVTAVVIATASLPLAHLLRRQRLVKGA